MHIDVYYSYIILTICRRDKRMFRMYLRVRTVTDCFSAILKEELF